MRAGDTVLHRPTGEKWLVAYVDGNRLAWYGWPPGEANVEDCELVKACFDEEHVAALREWAERKPQRSDESDRRISVCRRQLEALAERQEG